MFPINREMREKLDELEQLLRGVLNDAGRTRKTLEKELRKLTERLPEAKETSAAVEELKDWLCADRNAYVSQRDALQQEKETLEQKLCAQQEQLEAQKREFDVQRAELVSGKTSREELEQKYANLVQSVIEYRDHLELQLGFAREQEAEQAASLIQSVLGKTRDILTENGVEVLDGLGTYDEKLQRIAAVTRTQDPQQHLQVVSSQKAGYRLQGKVIRPQEVEVLQYTEHK